MLGILAAPNSGSPWWLRMMCWRTVSAPAGKAHAQCGEPEQDRLGHEALRPLFEKQKVAPLVDIEHATQETEVVDRVGQAEQAERGHDVLDFELPDRDGETLDPALGGDGALELIEGIHRAEAPVGDGGCT